MSGASRTIGTTTIRLVHAPLDKLRIEVKRALQWMDREIFRADSHLEGKDIQKAWWWIAYTNEDIPVGFAGLEYAYADRGRLCLAGVMPWARGKGLQRRLIRVRERRARMLGWKRLLTYTTTTNTPSANNLIRCGYLLWEPEGIRQTSGFIHWYRDL